MNRLNRPGYDIELRVKPTADPVPPDGGRRPTAPCPELPSRRFQQRELGPTDQLSEISIKADEMFTQMHGCCSEPIGIKTKALPAAAPVAACPSQARATA